MLLAHLSDVHLPPVPRPPLRALLSKRFFGYLSWCRKRRLLHRIEPLAAIERHLRDEPVDHTVISGDLVNISLAAEFAAARHWLEQVGTPEQISVIPGNHDAYTGRAYFRGWQLWGDYMRSDDEESDFQFPTLRRRGNMALIGVSSAIPTAIGLAQGQIGDAQLQRLEGILARERQGQDIRVVQLHHPPMFSKRRRGLRDQAAFIQLIAKHGAELIITGHEHHFQLGALPSPEYYVPVVSGPSASLMGFDGPKTGGYLRYRLPEYRGGTIAIERFGYDPQRDQMISLVSGELKSGPEGTWIS